MSSLLCEITRVFIIRTLQHLGELFPEALQAFQPLKPTRSLSPASCRKPQAYLSTAPLGTCLDVAPQSWPLSLEMIFAESYSSFFLFFGCAMVSSDPTIRYYKYMWDIQKEFLQVISRVKPTRVASIHDIWGRSQPG